MMTKLFKCAPLLTVLVVWWAVAALSAEKAENEDRDVIIAKGDSFEIRKSYVDKFQTFIESGGQMKTTPKEYRKGAVQLKLFALEAAEIGLNPQELDLKENLNLGEDFERDVKLHFLFIKYLTESYKPDDLIVESYYYSNPKKFRVLDENKELKLKPLDDDVKKSLGPWLVGQMRENIIKDEAVRLKQKYGVRMCGDKGGC